MSIGKRLAALFQIKVNKALDSAEDPRETLDYSYEQQLKLLQNVRRGLVEVATSRKRIELQAQKLTAAVEKLQQQAMAAMKMGKEDLAKEALTRREAIATQLADLQVQHAALNTQEQNLTVASRRLEAKVEAFRTQKETIKATYTAAEASTKIAEAVSGISEEMGDVGMAMQRAQDKTEQMQARAGALDNLLESGALDDLTLGSPNGDIDRQLSELNASSSVDAQLAQMRAALGSGTAPAEISAAPSTPATKG